MSLPNPFPHRYDIDTLTQALMGSAPVYLNTQTGDLQPEATPGTYLLTPLPEEIQASLHTNPDSPRLLRTYALEWLKSYNLIPPSLLHIPTTFSTPQTAKVRINHAE